MASPADEQLWQAVYGGDFGAAQLALDAGAKPDWRGPDGERPLTLAARWAGAERCVKSLLQHGARVDLMNATWHTPLMIAAANGRLALVRVLLDAGADVDRVNRNEETPLTYAIALRRFKVVEHLLARGADVEQHQLRWSPLMYAANQHDPRIIALLLAHGADPGRTDESGRTPHDIASQPRLGPGQRARAVTPRQRESIRLLQRAPAAKSAKRTKRTKRG